MLMEGYVLQYIFGAAESTQWNANTLSDAVLV